MKVRVEGENGTASILRGYLQANDYYLLPGLLSGLVPEPADFTFYVSERAAVKWPVLEGIDSSLFLAATKRLGELTPGGAVVLIYRGHEYGDTSIGVTVPADDGERTAVARAMLRALNDMRKAGLPRVVPKVRWWKRALWVVGLALLPAAASAQPVYWPVKFVTSSGSVIWAGDAANNAVRVNVVASTGGGGGLTDAELRATPVPVSGSGNFAVTGTFWQATQPVSGTFWQATQPVSGTFWQATQPVSGPLTDAQLRAVAVPVSGTFFQATQPVSIAASVTVTDGAGALNVIVDSGAITANVPAGLDVDVLTLPALVAGSANIGDVDIATMPAITGTVAVSSMTPSAAATSNNDGACVSVTTTSGTVLASFATRAFAAVCSRVTNTDIVYLKLAATSTTSDLPLEIGQCFNLTGPRVYTGVIDSRSAAGTQSICVVEW